MTTRAEEAQAERDPEHARGLDFVLVVLGAVLWGTGGLAGAALAGRGTDMLTVACLRLGLGGGVLLAGLLVAGRLGRVPRTRQVLVRVAATAALAAVYQACYFLAVQMTSVGVATFVALGASPVIVAGVTAVRTRRGPDPRTRAAVVLALAGLALLVGFRGGGSAPVAGAGLALLAAAAFATMTMVNRRPVAGLDALVLTGTSFTLGAVMLAPVAVLTASAGLPSGGAGWLLVAYLGIGPTAMAYVAFFAGLRTVPSTTASLLALLEPLTAAVGAYLLRGEALGATGLLGALLLGSAVAVLRPRRVSPTMAAGLH